MDLHLRGKRVLITGSSKGIGTAARNSMPVSIRITPTSLSDLSAFVSVSRNNGFRGAGRVTGMSSSALSDSVRRLEQRTGVRLLDRTTRSVVLTEAGAKLLERLEPALVDVEGALEVLEGFRNSTAGLLRLNVPVVVAQLVLPPIAEAFLLQHPEVRLEVVVEDDFVDVLKAGCQAGIRYGKSLDQDMVAVPIGPRRQRFATAAASSYLDAHGRPQHPTELLRHACVRHRFPSGAMNSWDFERDGETFRVDPTGPLVVTTTAMDMEISAAVSGLGVVHLFEDLLRPALNSGALEPLLEEWWTSFPGPFLYFPSRRHMPGHLRAFVDFVKAWSRKGDAGTG
jgi:DNA-binding transcriptional LysR family regulator